MKEKKPSIPTTIIKGVSEYQKNHQRREELSSKGQMGFFLLRFSVILFFCCIIILCFISVIFLFSCKCDLFTILYLFDLFYAPFKGAYSILYCFAKSSNPLDIICKHTVFPLFEPDVVLFFNPSPKCGSIRGTLIF